MLISSYASTCQWTEDFFKGTINTSHILFWIKIGDCDLAEKLFLDSFVSHPFTFYNSTKCISRSMTKKATIFFIWVHTYLTPLETVFPFWNHPSLDIVISFTSPKGLTLHNFEIEEFLMSLLFHCIYWTGQHLHFTVILSWYINL